ncbi:Flp pilus assembly protein TadB [Catalinimonas alkaloidigena]|jgi:hypothetical protein|uniref:hypothetical protein n=1 Tax=Catalinimonas TaxID=1522128 RepID=UPI0024054340|nr:hypothetical protein [Catalinimonas alkaloidigena]MDF9799101.1 Flp pilus assembly protein TadB [Catalinimonas alkaloidigena]
MKSFKSIERKAQLLGLPMQDLFALLFGLALAMVLGIVINFFLPVSKYYFFAVLAATVIAFFLLKRVNLRRHPSFLFSLLSYRFFQPKCLEVWGNRRNDLSK